MGKLFSVEAVNNGYIIGYKEKKFLAKNGLDLGRIITNLVTDEEYYNLKRNKQTRVMN